MALWRGAVTAARGGRPFTDASWAKYVASYVGPKGSCAQPATEPAGSGKADGLDLVLGIAKDMSAPGYGYDTYARDFGYACPDRLPVLAQARADLAAELAAAKADRANCPLTRGKVYQSAVICQELGITS